MAAGSTYTPIATATANGSQVTISFTSIPSTYTDLVVIAQASISSGASNIGMRFNGSGGTAYSETWINGNGTSATSGRGSSQSYTNIDGDSYPTSTTTTVYNVSIMNYANTSTYKTYISRASNGSRGTASEVCLWQSTAAINRVDLFVASSANFTSGSTFTLYGIQAA